MSQRIPLITAALGLAAAALITSTSAGCGRSVAFECLRVCQLNCDVADDCEPLTGQNADPEDCRADCELNCDQFELDSRKECPNGVDIKGDLVDACYDALDSLGQLCRDSSTGTGQFLDAATEVVDACSEDFYDCL